MGKNQGGLLGRGGACPESCKQEENMNTSCKEGSMGKGLEAEGSRARGPGRNQYGWNPEVRARVERS